MGNTCAHKFFNFWDTLIRIRIGTYQNRKTQKEKTVNVLKCWMYSFEGWGFSKLPEKPPFFQRNFQLFQTCFSSFLLWWTILTTYEVCKETNWAGRHNLRTVQNKRDSAEIKYTENAFLHIKTFEQLTHLLPGHRPSSHRRRYFQKLAAVIGIKMSSQLQFLPYFAPAVFFLVLKVK